MNIFCAHTCVKCQLSVAEYASIKVHFHSVGEWVSINSQALGIVGATLYYSDVIMIAMAYQITASPLFAQPFVGAQITEKMKAPRH